MEVEETLKSHKPGEIDWITFVGSGEPTLHSKIGWLIREVKLITELPVAVITNGSLLYLPEVRKELLDADAVLPSLDAGEKWLYRKINRPHPEVSFERLLDGLSAFRKEYPGRLWVEVMLMHGINDTKIALNDIAVAMQKVHPDEVHINLPTRPPAETWVHTADEAGLMRAKVILGGNAKVVLPIEGLFDLESDENLVQAILGIISRHPMSEGELIGMLGQWVPGEIYETLDALQKSGQSQVVERNGVRFWTAAHSYFPDKESSMRTAPEMQ